MTMVRRVALGALALLFVAGVAVAGETKEANGTVKSVATNTFVVTDTAGKDWTFDVDKTTLVLVKGGSHKMDAIKADGKPAQLSEFLSAKQDVHVQYSEKEGKNVAKEVRVKGAAVK
jgi:ABC-type Fe3+-hydroxamate transport system substrate-binding protein